MESINQSKLTLMESEGLLLKRKGRWVMSGRSRGWIEVALLVLVSGAMSNASAFAVTGSLAWSSFLGGSGNDICYGVAVDSSGYLYATGKTLSTNFPATSGAFDETDNAYDDVFVTKFESDGTGLLYSTYLGGSNMDTIGSGGIFIDNSGHAYLGGSTTSNDFPVTSGVYNESRTGDADFFVTKLNSSGSGLEFSTYLGGSYADFASGIEVDSSGNVYVAGGTNSSNFPTTSGAYCGSYQGTGDVIVCKLNSSATGLLYSTYLGGTNMEQSPAFAVNDNGEALVAGDTFSSDFPTTSGAYDQSHGGNWDAYLSKLNSTGTGLSYSTFLGGSAWEAARFVGCDSAGCVYLAGNTSSSDFPVTSGAYDVTKNGTYDIFITKFASNLATLEYSTFLGGSGYESCWVGTVTSSGCVYVTGEVEASDFPTTSGAYDDTYDGEWGDAFISRLSSDGSELEYSTYLGGDDHCDMALAIAVDSSGNAYVGGETHSDDFPATSGAYDESYNGGGDAFVAKFALEYTLEVNIEPAAGGSVSKNPNKTTYHYGEQVTLTATANNGYSFDEWSGDIDYSSENPETVTVTGDMSVTASFFHEHYFLICYTSPPWSGWVSRNPNQGMFYYGDVVTLTAIPGYGYAFSYWSGDIGGSENPKCITITGNTIATPNFYWVGGGGCR